MSHKDDRDDRAAPAPQSAMDPGLAAQFERAGIVRHELTRVRRADALQWHHYEPVAARCREEALR